MSLLEGLGKIVAGTGDIVNWAGSMLQEGGEYLGKPEAKDEIKAKTKSTANNVKDTVVDTAQTVTHSASDWGKQFANMVDSGLKSSSDNDDIVVDYPDVTPAPAEKKPVVVEILTPHPLKQDK
ncbi:hypothetical protein [Weissella minor]|uniref:Uncharacterized protein n=1 Tax=Weissella minor TaxID=1620 RepID=A0A0R2JGL4_9LACO|nr:hypothetical protein [Weissella minor]KRN76494.1 hypothetical protein IV67_GL000754 [Weissella minor]